MPAPESQAPAAPAIANFADRWPQRPAGWQVAASATAVAAPRLLVFNRPLADALGLTVDDLSDAQLADLLSGNTVPAGARPVALAYAGHQFGNFVPQLGDGRALLLGELTDRTGATHDLQLKGAGRTPFSRRGDGRAALGPVLREYLVSEAMHGLGIPTTRALAAVATGETVLREMALPGAVLARVATSHIRVGTFQYFAARQDLAGLRALADHVIARHDPGVAAAPAPYLALLEAIAERQVRLVAQWMQVGFIHGVMNTDNMAVSGQTLDYGPCAFMEAYHPDTVFSAIDTQGRYAFGNQPVMMAWNLARLAEALLPLIDPDPAEAARQAQALVYTLQDRCRAHYLAGMAGKLGLQSLAEDDAVLIDGLLDRLAAAGADYTRSLRALSLALPATLAERQAIEADNGLTSADLPDLGDWLAQWHARLNRQPAEALACAQAMHACNPLYIPRNHRVEQALQAAASGDLAPFLALQAVLARPFSVQAGAARFAAAATASEQVHRTFCGT